MHFNYEKYIVGLVLVIGVGFYVFNHYIPNRTLNNEEYAQVKRVIDGDTIVLTDGRKVRYIGIDAPESVDPKKTIECFAKKASEKNKELVEGKKVRLVKDFSEQDKYDRKLRYVYVGNIFVNDYLVRHGYAKAKAYLPDIHYQKQFKRSQTEAQNKQAGLWAADACR